MRPGREEARDRLGWHHWRRNLDELLLPCSYPLCHLPPSTSTNSESGAQPARSSEPKLSHLQGFVLRLSRQGRFYVRRGIAMGREGFWLLGPSRSTVRGTWFGWQLEESWTPASENQPVTIWRQLQNAEVLPGLQVHISRVVRFLRRRLRSIVAEGPGSKFSRKEAA